MSNNEESSLLRARVAALESKIDMLETEFQYLNQILIDCGFSNGIETLKMTVEEVISERLDLPSLNHQKDEDSL
jgi:hypothetical protein